MDTRGTPETGITFTHEPLNEPTDSPIRAMPRPAATAVNTLLMPACSSTICGVRLNWTNVSSMSSK